MLQRMFYATVFATTVLARLSTHLSWSKNSRTDGVVSPVSVPRPSTCHARSHVIDSQTIYFRKCKMLECACLSCSERGGEHLDIAGCVHCASSLQVVPRIGALLAHRLRRTRNSCLSIRALGGQGFAWTGTAVGQRMDQDIRAVNRRPSIVRTCLGNERFGCLRPRAGAVSRQRRLPKGGLREGPESKHPSTLAAREASCCGGRRH